MTANQDEDLIERIADANSGLVLSLFRVWGYPGHPGWRLHTNISVPPIRLWQNYDQFFIDHRKARRAFEIELERYGVRHPRMKAYDQAFQELLEEGAVAQVRRHISDENSQSEIDYAVKRRMRGR